MKLSSTPRVQGMAASHVLLQSGESGWSTAVKYSQNLLEGWFSHGNNPMTSMECAHVPQVHPVSPNTGLIKQYVYTTLNARLII